MLNGRKPCPNDEGAHQQETGEANAEKDFELALELIIGLQLSHEF
jgi:hypothetical protein